MQVAELPAASVAVTVNVPPDSGVNVVPEGTGPAQPVMPEPASVQE